MLAAAKGCCVMLSYDRGATWYRRLEVANYTAVAASGDGTRMVVVGGRPADSKGTNTPIWLFTGYGDRWDPVSLSPDLSYCLSAVSMSDDGAFIAAAPCYKGGVLLVSSDGGGSWREMEVGSSSPALALKVTGEGDSIFVLTRSATSALVLLAGSTGGAPGGSYSWSTSGVPISGPGPFSLSASWDAAVVMVHSPSKLVVSSNYGGEPWVEAPLAGSGGERWTASGMSLFGEKLYALRTSTSLDAATGSTQSVQQLVSSDQGASWSMPTTLTTYPSVLSSQLNGPANLAASADGSLLAVTYDTTLPPVSTDGGSSWPMPANLQGNSVFSWVGLAITSGEHAPPTGRGLHCTIRTACSVVLHACGAVLHACFGAERLSALISTLLTATRVVLAP